MSSQQERAEAKRKEKLAQIKEQVEDGSLVIRQMTPAERKANPPRPRRNKQRKSR
jgi:anti-sigma28 factor (negative regulator of flagellin synthesis)